MRTSTVRFENLAALERVFAKRAAGERAISYGRSGMDTHRALEEVFMQLEGGTYCVLAPSGMAAINIAFLGILKTGDSKAWEFLSHTSRHKTILTHSLRQKQK
jgi:cystathionine beta-lyase